MAKKLTHYQAAGFYLISKLQTGGLKKGILTTSQNIAKGDALYDAGSGLLSAQTSDFTAAFMGIAAEAVDDSAGAGGKTIMYIPPYPHNQFSVPAATTVLAQSDVGELLDLDDDANTILASDTVTTGWAFVIDDIDISAEALAANTQGYAIGHFEMRAAQS
jgi:hypothetical protein